MYERRERSVAMPFLKIGRKQYRWLLVPQLMVAAMLGLMLVASNYQTSHAASLAPQIDTTTCANPGMLVDVYPIKANGTKIGEVDLYYSRDKSFNVGGVEVNGFNCAWTRTVGPAYGKAQHIAISLIGCDSNAGEDCVGDGQDSDIGDYHFYAGPASSTGSGGSCISVEGTITWNGATYKGGTDGKAAHCGK
jgi:hypothetical protein